MKLLVTTDLHLNTRPDDRYRWSFFEGLPDLCEQFGTKSILILGDLTHEKDKHSSVLVNRVVNNIQAMWEDYGINLRILKGNHDYVEESKPYMQFLNHIGNVTFITDPWLTTIGKRRALFLPHTRDPVGTWQSDYKDIDYIFMHQSVGGAVASNGMSLDGFPRNFFHDRGFKGKVISGDIHVPQTVGRVIYIGTPYAVHFGDMFSPRIAVIDTKYPPKDKRALKYMASDSYPKKVSINMSTMEDLESAELEPGDFIKVKYNIRRADFSTWREVRSRILKYADSKGVLVRGLEIKEIKRNRVELKNAPSNKNKSYQSVTDEQAIEVFAKREKLGISLIEQGKEFL